MSFKHWLLFIFLTIITFGLFLIYVYFYKIHNKNTNSFQTEKISINVEKLVLYLGGINNINQVEYKAKKLKIYFKDKKKINLIQLKRIKNLSGVLVTSIFLTILFSNSPKPIFNKILTLKSK